MPVSYIICAAGDGTRFQPILGNTPKALIHLFEDSLLEWSLRSLPLFADDQVIIVTQKKHRIREKLHRKISSTWHFNKIHWIELDTVTRGQLETAYKTRTIVPQENALVVYNCDTYFQSRTLVNLINNPHVAGIIPCAEAEGTSWSFCLTDTNDRIMRVAEKERISAWATVGLYYFRDAEIFFSKAEIALNAPPVSNNEYYVAPLYNQYIQEGHTIMMDKVCLFKPMGTPEQISTYWGVTHQLLKSNNLSPVLVIDLDNTITIDEPGTPYPNKKPNIEIIEKMREFAAHGWEIIIYTSRRMQTFKNNEAKILKDIGAITYQWLKEHKVPYDGIRFGKPYAHNGFYVDDKAMTPEQFLQVNLSDVY